MARRQNVTMFKEAYLWCEQETKLYQKLCTGRILHLFSGQSLLGNVRVDIEKFSSVTYPFDLSWGSLPFQDNEFDTIIADPPWTGPREWRSWLSLLREMERVSGSKIVLVLGNLFYHLKRPWKLTHIYVVKRSSPQIKLVYVWEKVDG